MRAVGIILAAVVFSAAASPALPAAPAPAPRPAATGSAAPPAQVEELLKLLAEPQVQTWLAEQRAGKPPANGASPAPDGSASHYFSARIGLIHDHLGAVVAALPTLPGQVERARALVSADIGERATAEILFHLALFIGLGFGAEWLFRWATRRIRGRLDTHPVETVKDRLHLIATRFAFGVGLIAAFAVGCVGPFLALDWAPMLREIVLGYLLAFVVARIALVVAHFFLAPKHERFRIVPVDPTAARFWSRRIVAFATWFAFGWVTIQVLRTLGFSLEGRQLVAYALGLGLLAIAIEAVWRRPIATGGDAAAASPLARRFGAGAQNTMLSVAIVLLWVLWVARAMPGFWLLLMVIVLPLCAHVTRRAVENLLRPPGSAPSAEAVPGVLVVFLERGIRALLIIAAAVLLAWGWGVDIESIAGRDTFLARLLHGIFSAVIIVLVADLVWHAAKAAIDAKLAEAGEPGHGEPGHGEPGHGEPGQPNTTEARRRARMRTLLPIFRNILFVLVIAVAAMMALAALGVEIGPLIAGAGVVGVAVGFGAQTFVRDVIAGMFYLVDDAFRVGEYIQAGNYKGTVEGFSIRSVRLRHHRGPVYTVPFSLLGAVQNQSRDWVIDKLTINVTHDSDLALAKKLIKQIGLDLAEDPEYAPLILEPLKMQGVDAFGEYGLQIRTKMMTLPGEQFVIRRQAYALIKKAFDANGIKFAFPTVQVAHEDEAVPAAVAQRAIELARPAAAAK